MATAIRISWRKLYCAAGLAVCLSGCQVRRTWFQMDSNSPVPFFGIDLLPRRSAQLQDRSPDLTVDGARLATDRPIRPVHARR